MTILVIDIGSSSVRASLFDMQARPLPNATVSEAHQFTTIPPGAATMDAVELQTRVERCIDTLLQHAQAPSIQVVGLATFTGNVIGVDAHGNAVTPIYSYADTRSADDVLQLKTEIDQQAAHQRTGCRLHTAYLPGRLHWLRRTEPETFAKVVSWDDVGSYLFRHWFGWKMGTTSYSVAAWTGLLNRASLTWDSDWLNILKLDTAHFPALTDYDQTQTGLNAAYAHRWSVLRNVPFCLAVGDGVAANVGSGCVDEAHVALTIGTTAALRVASSAQLPPVPDGLWSYRIHAGLHLLGGATSEGGNIFHWARGTLALGDTDLETALANREPDSHGLTVLPLLAGERSPGWAAHATGAIVGLRLSTTPLDMLQAALEGVALRLALIAEQLEEVCTRDAAVVGGGGALVASPAWTQIIANALNRPLHITAETEITARGVALLARRALIHSELTDFPPPIVNVVHPNPIHAAILHSARERQVELYQKMVAS